jgi:tetratricopeptide (TPR) repeat protein
VGEHTENEELIIESYGNSNQTQTLPQNAKINVLAIEFTPELLQKKQQLENLIGKHIRFEYGKNDVTDLVKISEVTQNRNQLFMLAYSLIDNQMNKYELRLIDAFEVIENPILMEGNNPKEIEACLDFAIENFKAALIGYATGGDVNKYKERTISKIHYHFSNSTALGLRYIPAYYANYIYDVRINLDKNTYNLTKSDINTFCHLRKEEYGKDGSHFVNDGRIKFIKVLETIYTNAEILDYIRMYCNHKAFYLILEQKYTEARYQLDKALKIAPNNLWCLGNLAHIYLLSGNYEKAIELHTKYKNVSINENITWLDNVKYDFAEFQKVGIVCNDFEKVLALLGD